jgi:lipopolysaccharide export LptBFGC system permease protein LptF
MRRLVWRNWALIVAFLALLVLVFWLVFDRPLGQTIISAVGGLIIGIAMVWWRGRGTRTR